MPTIHFESASPAVGSDIFTDVAVKPYTKGRTTRKVAWICIIDGTLGTGKFELKYGADVIATGLQSTTTDAVPNYLHDIQPIVDKRWCSAQQEMTLEVTEAPAATVEITVGIIEKMVV